jgi:hypothetical protein
MQSEELDFELVRFVILSSGKDHISRFQPLTRFYSGDIKLWNKSGQKNILYITTSGYFINHIGNAGRSTREYIRALDIVKYDDTISVLASYVEDSKIIFIHGHLIFGACKIFCVNW